MERGKVLTTKLLSQGYLKTKLVATLKKFMGDIMIWSIPTMWQFPELFLFLTMTAISRLPKSRTYASTVISFVQAYGHGGQACLPSNAYYPRTPDYTHYSGVHVCWSEHYDSSFVYRFMSLDYGLGIMTPTT